MAKRNKGIASPDFQGLCCVELFLFSRFISLVPGFLVVIVECDICYTTLPVGTFSSLHI